MNTISDEEIEILSDWIKEAIKSRKVMSIEEDSFNELNTLVARQNMEKYHALMRSSRDVIESTKKAFHDGNFEELAKNLFSTLGKSQDKVVRAFSVYSSAVYKTKLDKLASLSSRAKNSAFTKMLDHLMSSKEISVIKRDGRLIARTEFRDQAKIVGSLTEYIKEVTSSNQNDLRFWRGQSSINYDVTPKLYRDGLQHVENELFQDALRWIPELSTKRSTFEILAKFQHYGFGTRLIDISQSPLVALYFSCTGDSKSRYSQVIEFSPPREMVLYSDSDRTSIISNLSKMESKFATFGNKGPEDFNSLTMTKKLVDEIRKEKPFFEPKINPADINRSYVVMPKLNDPRIIAQAGAFILTGINHQKYYPNSMHWGWIKRRYVIPKDRRELILKDLDQLGIHTRALFPDIEGLSKYAKNLAF